MSLIIETVSELRRDHDIVATFAEGAGEEFFALTGAVYISRIEKIDALIQRSVHYLCCGISVESSAEIVTAESHPGYIEGPDSSFIHAGHFR